MTEKRGTPGGQPTQDSGQRASDLAEAALATAAKRMRDEGFDIGDRVEVVVDPRLPIMGYTMSGEGGRFRITVSGGAVRSGMLEGLLVHEMSHIYRMRTKHPSHNPRIIEEAMERAGNGVATKDYQRKTLHDLVNNVEDLYADDIAFRVIRKSGVLTPEQASEFLQDWVEDQPVESRDAARARWGNAWLVANNARAIAQMARHGVEDTGGIAAEANRRLMSHMAGTAPRYFEYVRGLLTNLKEDITPDEFRALLLDYLSRFLEFAQPERPAE